ncbi:general amidase [Paecilomyces variotii No. 5]|uniref:amidase n=1 Tax=Byssochlamys spectabilis (strain No. 5 / NBRC 109023) TaxID=1356009 RepID=V5I5R7_BYSSN|nr:general amidase [Paecilomyces variotii No. 5]
MDPQSSEPAYLSIARQKQDQLNTLIPPEWRLPAHLIPSGMLSAADSVTKTREYGRINVVDVPRTCGLLTSKEIEITEKWDAKGLLQEAARGRLSAEEITTAFSKRAAVAHQLTRCLTEPLFASAIKRGKELDEHLKRTGKTVGPLHGLPVSVKDSFNVKGVDSSIGIAALAFKPAKENASLVDLLLSLGAIIIAKTNVPQTLGALDSCNNVFGRTLNPLNRQLTAGGSSGGEGVLVAMHGSMIGFGTDIGGSIRVPAMCNGIYGFKPSNGRVPYGGQESGQLDGKGRVSLQPVAGPLARSVDDLGTVMKEIVPRAELFGEDCIPGKWESETALKPLGDSRKFTVGMLRSDGLVEPLPPVAKVLDEVAQILRETEGIEVVEIPVPPIFKKCQGVAGRLMNVDGGGNMMDLLESTSEPLIPWLKGRMGRGKPIPVTKLYQLQAERSKIEKEMLKLWTSPDGTGDDNNNHERRIDAIICPVAPHPVPELDRYNAVGYTSSFVLLDYPAGSLPVRPFREPDLETGKEMTAQVLGSWDRKNRELWDEKTVDRRVYLDSPLSVQVVTPKLHDYDLFQAMQIIDRALRRDGGAASSKRGDSKL